MSRAGQWGTIAHALRTSWPWPAEDAEVDDLAAKVSTWSDLGPMVAAVEYHQRNTPDRRPSVTQLLAEADRRRRARANPAGQQPPCPTCDSEGWIITGWADDARRLPNLKPCPTCRPGTAQMHARGLYQPDAALHSIANRSPLAEAAREANQTAPTYGPRHRGPDIARPGPTHLETTP